MTDKPNPSDDFERLVGAPGEEAGKIALNTLILPGVVGFKGKLALFGGALNSGYIEDERSVDSIDDQVDPTGLYQKMVDDFALKGKTITVITSASESAVDSGLKLERILKKYGVKEVHIVSTRDHAEAMKLSPRMVDESAMVYMAGGDQEDLYKALHDTPILKSITKKLKTVPEFVVAGTSAGAMVMSGPMMFDGELRQGFGWIPWVVDTHFLTRDRDSRLRRVVTEVGNQQRGASVGLAVEEGAGVVVNGATGMLSVFGAGHTMEELAAAQKSGQPLASPAEKPFGLYLKNLGEDVGVKLFPCKAGTCIARLNTCQTEAPPPQRAAALGGACR